MIKRLKWFNQTCYALFNPSNILYNIGNIWIINSVFRRKICLNTYFWYQDYKVVTLPKKREKLIQTYFTNKPIFIVIMVKLITYPHYLNTLGQFFLLISPCYVVKFCILSLFPSLLNYVINWHILPLPF